MAAATQNVAIELPKLNIEVMDIILVGDTPLIVHAWSKKAKTEMLNKQMGVPSPKKAKKDPEKDFIESLYPMDEAGDGNFHVNGDRLTGGRWGFPVIAFKAAAVTACTSIANITKVQARQAFHVVGDVRTGYEGLTPYSGELVEIRGADPRKREDMVRVGMGTADIRYRGEFWPWHVKLRVRFNANVLSAAEIANMLNTAGFGVGVGEWRSEKDGDKGLFHVATEADLAALEERKAA